MKKNRKIFTIFLVTLSSMFIFLGFSKIVNAINQETFSANVLNGFYIKKLYANGSGKFKEISKITRNSDGRFVYCVQPWVDLAENSNYDLNSFDQEKILNVSSDTWKRLTLIAYYGYGYGNHTDDRWYGMTQLMIWRTVFPEGQFYFTKTANGSRDYNYDYMEQEIERLINEHYAIPSFSNSNLSMNIGESVDLQDSNNLLDKFDITTDNNIVSVDKVGSTLNITAKNLGSTDITLTKKYDETSLDEIPLLYNQGDAQKVMSRGKPDPVRINLRVNVTGGKIRIRKVDSETQSIIPQGKGSLIGAKYEVYNSKNELVSTLTIGNDNTAITEYLPIGTYTIKELSPSLGYYKNENIDTVNVNSSEIFDITVTEQVIKGRIKILKTDSETHSCQALGEASLVGAKYNIINSKGEIVDTLTIGNDCSATSKKLPYDTYQVKEIKNPVGYKLNTEVFTVNITQDNIETVNAQEQVIKGRIKILKTDSETHSCQALGEASLVGAKYNIINSKGEIVDTLTIGNDCSATSKLLPYGNYTVKELQSSLGYKIDKGIYPAMISEDQSIITITSTEEVIKGRIKILKVDSENKVCKAQGEGSLIGAKYQIIDSKGNIVDILTTGNDCSATSKLLPYGSYTIKEEKNSLGYYLNTKISSSFIKEELTYSVTVTEQVIKNKFQFYKFYGNQNTGLIYAEANAEFNVIDFKNNVVATFKTDKNGYAEITLPYGTYTVIQTKGLDEYKIVAPFTITVNENTQLIQTNYLKNGPITARLKLIKIDSETKEVIPIKDAKFKIKNKKTNEYVCLTTDKVICEFNTNEEGIMITPLPLFAGDYLIEEITAPYNYLLETKPIEFSIKENTDIVEDKLYGSLVVVKFKNQAVKGKLEIHKVGEKVVIENGKFSYMEVPLPNITFGLYDENGILIGTYVTDQNGYIEVSGLKLGKYILKELSTDDNYVLDNTAYEFELVYKDQYTPIITKTFTLKNNLKKGTLQFTKQDLTSGKEIPNVKIEIYTDKDELIFSGITDAKGKVIIENLFVGKFYIIEKETVTGYKLSEEKVFFEIKENGQIVKSQMTNEKIKSTVKLHKVDQEGNALAGVTIEVYDIDGKLLGSYITDENGYIEVELEYGSYYLQEIKTLEQYVLSDEKVYFDVTKDGEIIQQTLVNELVDVPDTLKNDNLSVEIISFILLSLGIGIITYVAKKKKL